MRVRPSSRSRLIFPEPTTTLHYRRRHVQSSSGYYKSCRHFRLVHYNIMISYLHYVLQRFEITYLQSPVWNPTSCSSDTQT